MEIPFFPRVSPSDPRGFRSASGVWRATRILRRVRCSSNPFERRRRRAVRTRTHTTGRVPSRRRTQKKPCKTRPRGRITSCIHVVNGRLRNAALRVVYTCVGREIIRTSRRRRQRRPCRGDLLNTIFFLPPPLAVQPVRQSLHRYVIPRERVCEIKHRRSVVCIRFGREISSCYNAREPVTPPTASSNDDDGVYCYCYYNRDVVANSFDSLSSVSCGVTRRYATEQVCSSTATINRFRSIVRYAAAARGNESAFERREKNMSSYVPVGRSHAPSDWKIAEKPVERRGVRLCVIRFSFYTSGARWADRLRATVKSSRAAGSRKTVLELESDGQTNRADDVGDFLRKMLRLTRVRRILLSGDVRIVIKRILVYYAIVLDTRSVRIARAHL